MARIILPILALWLFWPRYDLDVSQDINWNSHRVVETNFFTLGACRQASGKYRSVDWVCLKKTGWGELTNDYSRYDSKHQ
jgi:hypothetical protein